MYYNIYLLKSEHTFWYNYFMDDVFAHLVFYILFKKIGEMIDSVVLISQGPILFFATAESNRQCCRSFTTRLQMSSKKWAKKYRKPFTLLGFRQSRRRDSFSAPVVAERASTGRAATTPSAAQIPCQSDSVVLMNKEPEIPYGISGSLFIEATGFEPTTSASRKLLTLLKSLKNRAFTESR